MGQTAFGKLVSDALAALPSFGRAGASVALICPWCDRVGLSTPRYAPDSVGTCCPFVLRSFAAAGGSSGGGGGGGSSSAASGDDGPALVSRPLSCGLMLPLWVVVCVHTTVKVGLAAPHPGPSVHEQVLLHTRVASHCHTSLLPQATSPQAPYCETAPCRLLLIRSPDDLSFPPSSHSFPAVPLLLILASRAPRRQYQSPRRIVRPL